jgi:hypothetical protein
MALFVALGSSSMATWSWSWSMQLGKDSASQLISTEFRAKINKAISQVP